MPKRTVLAAALLAFLNLTAAAQVAPRARGVGDAPADALARFLKGDEHYYAGRYAEAVEEYKRGVAAGRGTAPVYKNLANAYNRLKQHREAIEAAQKALELQPADTYSRNEMGYAYSHLKLHKEAAEAYEQTLRLDAVNHYALREVAWAYLEIGRYDDSINAAQRAVKLRPGDDISYNNMGYSYMRKGQYEDAVKALRQAVNLNPGSLKANNNLGHAYMLLGRHDEAAVALKQAISIKPGEFSPRFNLAGVYFAQRHYREALDELKQAVRIDPSHLGAHIATGLAANHAGEYELAVDAFTQVLRLRPQESNAFFNRAYSHLYLGRGAEAAADARRYVELSGGVNRRDLYMYIAAHLGYRQAGRDGEAAALLEDLPESAGDASAWPRPVVAYLRRQLKAEELLAQATDGDKKTEAQAYVGVDLLLSGRRDEALPYLRWVVENGNKEFTEYAMAVAELKRLEGKSR